LPDDIFGTCFIQFDTMVAMIFSRLVNVVTGKPHEDYKIDYEEKINSYLQIFHQTSNHISVVNKLPEAI
jgi:hypothetical protein